MEIEKIDLYQKANMRIDKNTSSRKYESISNTRTIPNLKNSRNLLIFQIGKFRKFPVLKIPNIFTLENSKNFQFGEFSKFVILKILKISNLENFKNLKS